MRNAGAPPRAVPSFRVYRQLALPLIAIVALCGCGLVGGAPRFVSWGHASCTDAMSACDAGNDRDDASRDRDLQAGESAVVTVRACDPESGQLAGGGRVVLRAGRTYRVASIGQAEEWLDAGVLATPEGGWLGSRRLFEPLLRVLGARTCRAPIYALVARVGSGRTFPLRSGESLVPSVDGRLVAFANDWPGLYANNCGHVAFTVEAIEEARQLHAPTHD